MTNTEIPFGSYYRYFLAMLFDEVFTKEELLKLKNIIQKEIDAMDKNESA